MSVLRLRNENRVVVLIGDKGATVINVIGEEVRSRHFIADTECKEWREVKTSVLRSGARVYFVLDHSDQVYTRHLVPAGSDFVANAIVRERSGNVVSHEGLNTAFLLEDSPSAVNSGHKECMFVEQSNSLGELFKSLLDAVSNDSAKDFKGILLFSVELINIAKKVASKGDELKKWAVFLAYTKAGDFRQIILRDGELYASCSVGVSHDEKELPDVIAGKVHQEAQSAVRGIEEGAKDEDVVMYLVVPGSVKSSLLAFNFGQVRVNILTPYELGKLLDIKDCIGVGGVYCDTVVLCFMMRHSGFRLLLHTADTFAMNKVRMLQKFGIVPTCALIFIVAVLNGLCFAEIADYKKREPELRAKSAHVLGELQTLRNDREFLRVNEMYEAVDLYRSLSNTNPCPIRKAIVPLGKLDRRGFKITSFSWAIEEDLRILIELGVILQSGKSEAVKEGLARIFTDYKIKVLPESGNKLRDRLIVHLEGE